ncbi:MAG: hypothetical protein IT379_13735, partial [Deltaproteobacteria bacterium]|nr:hypothetical protein [Deltaproteobacteria bacterium]
QSRLGNPARPATDLSPGTFMLAVHHGDATWLVVSRTVEPSWSTGDASLVERGPIAVTRKAAVPGALPPELAALGGSDVRLFGARADVCSGRIAELAVMRRADVHPSTERIWERESGEPAAIAARIAAAAWDLGADGAMLVGRVESSSSACSGAHWGRLAALPFPTLFVPIPPPPPVAAHALESFRLLPSWRALQREYTTATRAAPDRPWDEHGAARPTVTLWSDGTTQWVSVTHRVALGDCDQWRGRLWALFEVEETGLALRTDVTDPGYHVPVASVDTDGDGAPDFVTEDGLVRRRGDVHQVVESLAYARHDRDCR